MFFHARFPRFIVSFLGLSLLALQASPSAVDPRVQALLSTMSLEEKVGQMTQLNITTILPGDYANTDGQPDPELLRQIVVDRKVGSLLTTSAYTLEHWHKLLTQIQASATQTPNRIPILFGIDSIHGATYVRESTLFPHNIGLAASRDPELARRAAQITALETRAAGPRWNFAPVLDVARNPLWARVPETYGEDPYLVTRMGVAAISGYEADGLANSTAVASCIKHFIGYGVPASGKDRTPSYIPEIQLREYHLPAFAAAIKAGASSIMINSGEVNGIPVHADRHLLTDVLRGELGFTGVAVSDWEDVIRLHTRHRVAATPKEAVRLAVMAGIDMSMVPHDLSFPELLLQLVRENEVPLSRIDEAVGRILTLKFNLGLFDHPNPEPAAAAQFGRPEYREAALHAALESMTLLKNENNILPLAKNTRVLVAGPGAESLSTLNGAWSYTWQGQDLSKYPARDLTIAGAIRELIGTNNVSSASISTYADLRNTDPALMRELAAQADVIILCLGEDAYAESPGNIDQILLAENQLSFAKNAIATGKPVVAVFTTGRPRTFRIIEPGLRAILLAYWPGSQGGPAIARTLFGDHNPSGRLPYSYPKFSGDLLTYDHKPSETYVQNLSNQQLNYGYNPQYPFGHGLSYTTFTYKKLRAPKKITGAETITVSVDVTNSGQRAGRHAIELYSRDLYASITPSDRRLRAFEKIELQPGETKTVTFTLTREDLSFINAQMKRVTEPGDFELMVGNLTAPLRYVE